MLVNINGSIDDLATNNISDHNPLKFIVTIGETATYDNENGDS